jgi:hypothetical protein
MFSSWDESRWFLVFILVMYNFTTIAVLKFLFFNIDIRAALQEKNTSSSAVIAAQSPAPAAGAGAPAAPAASDGDLTSYSRVTGLIGAVIMAMFLWALGNILIHDLWAGKTSDAEKAVGALSNYFLAGVSLFAPYAVNQARSAFKP